MKEFKDTGKATHCDALGNPIEIGKIYGFTKNHNGFTQVTIGMAKKFTDNGVTLNVISCSKALYDYDPEPEEHKVTTTTRGMMMFPILPQPTKKDYSVRGNGNGFAHLD